MVGCQSYIEGELRMRTVYEIDPIIKVLRDAPHPSKEFKKAVEGLILMLKGQPKYDDSIWNDRNIDP